MTRWQDVNGIYQIYPRSFKDANNDGVGDIAGITEKLDYIKGGSESLGVDAVWISPFYMSPMADFGYDISDYYQVDPLFGTNEDFETFLKAAHARDIKVMIDFVPNHTSDEHPWFVASRSSRDSDMRDWYVWRDPKPDGSPPNNWISVFGGSAWKLDSATGQYYLHSFLDKQPDLNWDNPVVRKAMMAVLDFWLSLGVDGIRTDAVRWISKDPDFRDNPRNKYYKEGDDDPYHVYYHKYSRYGDNLYSYLKEIAATVEKYPDRIVLFEDYQDENIDSGDQYAEFYSVNPSVAAPFNFEGMAIPYGADNFRTLINRFQGVVGNELRPFYCFGNHDQSRLATRVGERQARLIGLLQLSLPGIPVIYYGDEIGMKDVMIPDDAVRDPFELQEPNRGLGRDPERTPMQWSSDPHAGFSNTTPWLPVASDFRAVNVAMERGDDKSSLAMYQALLELRHSSALSIGEYVEWPDSNSKVFGFNRRSTNESLLILLNMSSTSVICKNDVAGEVIYSTHPSIESVEGEGIELLPHQGVIIRS